MALLIDSGACWEQVQPDVGGAVAGCGRSPVSRPGLFWPKGPQRSAYAKAEVVDSHSSPLVDRPEAVSAARGPRRSLDVQRAPPTNSPTQQQQQQQQQQQGGDSCTAVSIKRKLRQRRYSIAIGESIPVRPLKTIQESRQASWKEDAVVLLDQFPAGAGAGTCYDSNKAGWDHVNQSSAGSSVCSLHTGVLGAIKGPPSTGSSCGSAASSARPDGRRHSQQWQLPWALGGNISAAPRRSSLNGGVDQAGVLALLQQAMLAHHHMKQQQRQPRRQSCPPQVLRLHQDGNTLTGLSQEQIWYLLQQQRREQLEQQELWRAQAQRLQQEEAEELSYRQQQEHEWEALQLRLQQLSSTSSSSGDSRRDPAAATGRCSSSTDRQRDAQGLQQLAAQHSEALAALQVIEGELQEIERTHSRLAAARSIAPPGSRAAMACDSALRQHQAVLQQALEARDDVAAALAEAAAALVGCARESAGHHRQSSDGCWEGADDASLSPADGEALPHPQALLQHFGHYAII